MTKLSRRELLSAKGIIDPVQKEYDITKDEIFEKYSNTKLPIDLDMPDSGIAPHTTSFGKKEAKHLLSRTLFGFSKATWDAYSAISLTQAVDDLLNTNATLNSQPKDYIKINLGPTPNPDYGKEWLTLPYNPSKLNDYRASLSYWLVGNVINHDNTILEKMVYFWHNHFATELQVIGRPEAGYDYFKLIRDNALGNFKTLVYDMTTNPGMLKYLNGIYNTKNAPDENYARELMELFTLGKGDDSQYTEDDVKAAAKVLTGWKINADWRSSYFNANSHQTNNKQFSSFFGNAIITGKSGIAGEQETQELIDLIFTKEDVIARYMVREFYRFFVYYNITAEIETNVIIPLANDFKQNWEIKPIIKNLLLSQHFFDPLNQGCYIKTPLDVYGNLAKNLNAYHPSATVEKEYKSYELAYFFGAGMGMALAEPPSVAGWPAFYQTPKFHEIWINSDTYPKRVQYCVFISYAGYPVVDEKILIDTIAFAELYGIDAKDPNKLVDYTCEFLLGLDISQASKDKIKLGSLLSGVPNDTYWTAAWDDYQNNPTDTANKNTVVLRLFVMFKYIFELPEFQLH